ncbi:hypothetical protein [Frankia sp. CiP3]|uniref:hypothetical protein n=1 Tax=Frankia sp. CiP3 TaxID=2880971 RepID=UPI001EF6BB10|nr:hypothetical protein [Frankia sp. CiP3]
MAAAAEADRLGVLAKEADDSDLRLRDALAAAHALVERRPDILGTDPTSGLTVAKVVDAVAEGAVGAQGAWDAWNAWDGLRAVVDPAATRRRACRPAHGTGHRRGRADVRRPLPPRRPRDRLVTAGATGPRVTGTTPGLHTSAKGDYPRKTSGTEDSARMLRPW